MDKLRSYIDIHDDCQCVGIWCWWSLKGQLGYDSWSDVPPWKLLAWAEDKNVAGDGSMWLPRCYYDTYPEQP